MRRLLVCFCTVAFVLNFSVPLQGKEPTYKHKTLGAWLKIFQDAKQGTSEDRRSVEAIRNIGSNGVPTLIQMLISHDINAQQSAVNGFEILGNLGASGIPALTNLLYGPNPVLNVLAANALGHIGVPALPALMDALTNHSYNIATLAALSLPEMGTNALAAVPIFLHELGSTNHFVRERAADALGNLHLEPENVVPALTNLLYDKSIAARCLALSSLGRFREQAQPWLSGIVPLLEDPEENVRASATNALCEIAPNRYKTSMLGKNL